MYTLRCLFVAAQEVFGKKKTQIRDSQTCTLSEPSFLTSTKKKTKVREEKEEEKLQ